MSVTDELSEALSLLKAGLDADEDSNVSDRVAFDLYSRAVQTCLVAKKTANDDITKNKLANLAVQALERAERLKAVMDKQTKNNDEDDDSGNDESQAMRSNEALASSTPSRLEYSLEEKKVLAITSMINGREFVPFLSFDPKKERFSMPLPFTDPHGVLKLSAKQKSKLRRWARPEEFASKPICVVGDKLDCFSVKQTVVSDCSFVASIAISAQYEKRFSKPLITAIIYPQNKRGQPVYSASGKYMVKLRINGVARKVVIDDQFPMGPDNQPLCSYSSNRFELWVSLLEKAYMKVMGGYDFPGSNSNIDLHALTGWIPERVSIREGDFDSDTFFKKLVERFHAGDVLVTLATGPMSDAEADRAGLVSTHAYALLDVREVNGKRLFMLKNPWSHLRWRGNFSELDERNWTAELKQKLNFEPKHAQNFDNGVFWIDYESVMRFFEVFYLNWNPVLFNHTFVVHHGWHAGKGPARDLFDVSHNPQYHLELNFDHSKSPKGALWILLSRHICDIDDFRDNKEYITVLVYKNDGKRVFYPFDPPPMIDGIRINSPHYLCQMVVDSKTPKRLTLVVAQYEKTTTIYYSLRVYASFPFKLRRINNPYRYKQEITSQWQGSSAGGCANYPETYKLNPKFQMVLDNDAEMLIQLKGPKQYQIGFDLKCLGAKQDTPLFKQQSSGPYRAGFVVMTVEVCAGTYELTPTTFRPGQESAFFLTVEANAGFSLKRVQ